MKYLLTGKYLLKTMVAAVLYSVAVTCATAGEPDLEPIPRIPQRYWFLYEPNLPFGKKETTRARKQLPFKIISLERRGGLGTEDYTVTLNRDGSAHFKGGINSPREGQFTGSVDLEDFGRLCYLFEKLRFSRLKEDIRRRKDHGSAGAAIIVRANRVGQPGRTENWEINNSGPIELWAIQMSIDAVANRIIWSPTNPDSNSK